MPSQQAGGLDIDAPRDLNSIPKTRDAILHEIAHALTPGYNNDAVWLAKGTQIGCFGQRERHRKPQPRACGVCCDAYNGGRLTTRFLLDWRKVESVIVEACV